MQTAQIKIPVEGTEMPAYLARPDSGEPAPAVIVLQEIFGVNAEMRRITDLVASAGYVALAINFYHREAPDLDCAYDDAGRTTGFAAAKHVTRETLTADLNASVAWLNSQAFVKSNHIATWGFCYGGSVAFLSATLPGIAGAVSFYGGQIVKPLISGGAPFLESAGELRAPILFAFGGQDQGIPAESVALIEQTLKAKNKPYELKVYPAKGHGFFRESAKNLDEPDMADAWARVQAFLKKALA